jgi:hypothetical protein
MTVKETEKDSSLLVTKCRPGFADRGMPTTANRCLSLMVVKTFCLCNKAQVQARYPVGQAQLRPEQVDVEGRRTRLE